MKKHQAPLVLCLLCIFTQTPDSVAQVLPEYWDRGSAMTAVESANVDAAVHEIASVSSLDDAQATLDGLRDVESRDDLALPAREAVIYEFARSLAELPREAVAVEVMRYLGNYQARVLVPHEDHGEAYVPLFNIRGAASGVENSWQRTEFAYEAISLLRTDPAQLVSAFAGSANRNQRAAYLDVLGQARMTEVQDVQDIALEQLGDSPELTPLVRVVAQRTADTYTLQRLLVHGRGAGLSSTLVQLGRQLPVMEVAALLDFAINEAPASNAALAIAAWWPQLKHVSTSRDTMVNLLGDPALGASAALALSQSPDIQTIKILQDTATDDSDAARRARMALDLSRDQLAGEARP